VIRRPLCIAARTSSVKTSFIRSVTRMRPSFASGVTCTVCAEQTATAATMTMSTIATYLDSIFT
jgi:hypothetical protein